MKIRKIVTKPHAAIYTGTRYDFSVQNTQKENKYAGPENANILFVI